MRRSTSLIAATLLAATLWAPAQAQTKKELVTKIVNLQMAQAEQFSLALTQQGPLQQMVQQAAQVLRTRVPEDKREATGKAMDEALRAYVKDVQPALRASLLKNAPTVLGAKLEAGFNEAELKQILQSLESPVLKKFNQLSGESQQALVQKVMQDNQALMTEKFKALDSKLADLLGLKNEAAKPATAPAPAPAPAGGK